MRRFSLLILLVLATGCSDQLDRPIRLVVPPDLEGPIGIWAHPNFPDRIKRQSDAYVITVPESGLVRTNNLDVFRMWHGTEVVDANGIAVSNVQGGQAMSSSEFEGEIIWFYRGPKAEHGTFMWDDWELRREWLQDRDVIDQDS